MTDERKPQSNEPFRPECRDFLIQATSAVLLIVINGVTWSLVAYYWVYGVAP